MKRVLFNIEKLSGWLWHKAYPLTALFAFEG
jgi:hypothetical protein